MEYSIESDIKALNRVWWLVALFGLISLGIGIFFVASPNETLSTFTVIAGIVLIIEGAISVLTAIFAKGEGRGLLAIVGVLGLIAGVILVKHPFSALVVFVMIVGIWLLVAGIVRLIAAVADSSARGANLILAIVDAIAGIVILTWPDLSLSTLAVIIGIVLIIRGLASIWLGFAIRSAMKDVTVVTVEG